MFSSNDLQSLYANMSHNTIDFSSYLNSTLLLSRQVANLIQNSFSSLGINQNTPSEQKNSYHQQHAMEQKKKAEMIQAYRQRMVPKTPEFGAKRAFDYRNETSVKIENEAFVQKKLKTNYLNAVETHSDSTSEGSLDHGDFKVKFEETVQERIEASLAFGDEPKRIKGLKIDKATKTTYYLVEWKTRSSGYKPQDRYVKSDEVLKSHGNLVAIFYESQLKDKIVA